MYEILEKLERQMRGTVFTLPQGISTLMKTSQAHTWRGVGTVMLAVQSKHLAQVGDMAPVLDEQKQGRSKALRG